MMTRIGFFLLWLLHFLPLPILAGFGNGLGLLLYTLAAERRMVAHTNLRLCFPELDTSGRAALLRSHFASLGMQLVEIGLTWWASDALVRRLIARCVYGMRIRRSRWVVSARMIGGRMIGTSDM